MASHVMITKGDSSAFASYLGSAATHVSLDLEDTVPDELKPATRDTVTAFLRAGRGTAPGKALGIRISPLATLDGLRDILLLQDNPLLPDFITLTKVESAAEIRLLCGLLGGKLAGISLKVIIETPRAVAHVEEIAGASPRIDALSVGGKDLSLAMQMERSWEPLFYARARIVMAAKQFRLDSIDEPYHPHADLQGLRENLIRIKAMGFTGKSATTFLQAPVINEVLGD